MSNRATLTETMRETLEELADAYARGRTETRDVDGRSAEALTRRGLATNRERAKLVAGDREPVARYAVTADGIRALGLDVWAEVRAHTALGALRRRFPGLGRELADRVAAAVKLVGPGEPATLYRVLTDPEGACALKAKAADAVVRAAAGVRPREELTT